MQPAAEAGLIRHRAHLRKRDQLLRVVNPPLLAGDNLGK